MSTRRSFLKALPVTGYAIALGAEASGTLHQPVNGDPNRLLNFSQEPPHPFQPLDRVAISSSVVGALEVRDGDHRVYFEAAAASSFQFLAAGALGTHSVSLLNGDNRAIATRIFTLDCKTDIEDEGGEMRQLLKDLEWTMAADGPVSAMRYKGEIFTCCDTWLMDNTNTMKGMKYFWPEVKSNVDFYAASQREDGMVWENFTPRTPAETDWERRFGYGDFARPAEDGRLLLRRAPVENHVEAYFLEAVYSAWKASGDTAWMAGKLDAAVRAVKYATTDPYRWSDKYRLLKRGFTVDTWDFLCESEARLVGGDPMVVDLKKTHFGIFFGDNTHLIAGLRGLAEMLQLAGRGGEAARFTALAGELEERLNVLCWNGEFFTHWVAEDPSLQLDLGVDMARQVSLSNAYSLNYGVGQPKSAAIVETYQRIRREMPPTAPGEFYSIYPPFERGFPEENEKWEYMNGGVMACTAGELALGAFRHGFAAYGADILRRYATIAREHNGFVPAILRGKKSEAPERTFTQVDLRSVANADTGAGAFGVLGWMGEPDNDLRNMPHGRQSFRGVPFDVIDPAGNGGRACIAVSSLDGFARHVGVPIGTKAKSFYMLHTKGGDDLAGKLTVKYGDGTSSTEYIRAGANIGHWWGPTDGEFNDRSGPTTPDRMQVAWRGANQKFGNVGVYVAGFSHPHPEKTVSALELDCLETDAKWMVLGVAHSDAPVYLPPWNDISYGMPNNWGAAALVAAIMEGLAGVEDKGAAFSAVKIAPRWQAAGVGSAKVWVRYPSSQGYVAYRYRYNAAARRITLEFTGSAQRIELEVAVPEGMALKRAVLDGKDVEAAMQGVGSSQFASLDVKGGGAHRLDVELVSS